MADAAEVTDLGTESTSSMFDMPAGEGAPASAPEAAPAGTAAPRIVTTPPTTAPAFAPAAQAEEPIDPIKALEEMFQAEYGPPPKTDEALLDPTKALEGITPDTPSYKRIQQLANVNNTLRGQYQAVQGQLGQMQAAVEQMQGWAQNAIAARDQTIQALQANLQALTSRMQALAAVPAANPQPQNPNDPAAALEQQWLQKLDGVMGKRVQEAMRPIMERNAQLEQRLQSFEAQNKQAEMRQTSDQYRTEALTNVRDVVLKGVDVSGMQPDDVRSLANGLAAQVLSNMMHNNVGPREAAMLVRQQLLRSSALFAKAASASFAAKRKQGTTEAQPFTQRRNAGQGTGMPPPEQLAKQGYRNELEYISAQLTGEAP